MVASLVSIPCVCILRKTGRMASQTARYYCAMVLILAFVQLATYFLLSTVVSIVVPLVEDAAGPVAGPFVGGLVLPVVATLYDAVAMQSWIAINRCWITTDTPAAVPFIQIYCVRVFAMSIRIVGFMPKLNVDGITQAKILLAMAGATSSSTLSNFSERTFVVQRMKNKISGSLAVMTPEVDSFLRVKSNLVFGEGFQLLLCIACTLPGGADWTTDYLVWLAPVIYVFSDLLVDLGMIMAHRVMYPMEGESWWGTRQRLRRPFMNWPAVQADGGEAYRAAAAAAKEGRTEIAEIVPHPAFRARWSQNSYFTDSRIGAMLVWGMNVWWLTTGFYLLYGECRLWLPKGYPRYYSNDLCT